LDLNRESIERRDFPSVRRGYDPAAVDAHLRALAEQMQVLAQRAAAAGEPSLSSAAATQVQGILEAAQATAVEIERKAQQDAQRTREDAAQEVERARAHVETLARASTALLAQVGSLDGEVSALAQSLRADVRAAAGEGTPVGEERPSGAGERLVGAGGEVSSGLEKRLVGSSTAGGEASSGAEQRLVGSSTAGGEASSGAEQQGSASPPVPAAAAPAPGEDEHRAALAPPAAHTPAAAEQSAPPFAVPAAEKRQDPAPSASVSAPQPSAAPQRGEDLDGARLVALNMALDGESRERTDRYLAESFQLSDRAKLLDEVYAAIES
jgi:DivIVA domain-containing protein